MSFLPERHRSPPPSWGRIGDRHSDAPQWRPAKQRTSLAPILLTGVLAAGVAWVIRNAVDHPRTAQPVAVDRRAEPRPAPRPSEKCSDADGTIHGWTGNGTGVTPHDWLHFLPPCPGRRR